MYPDIWIGNHSIRSFAALLPRIAVAYGEAQVSQYSGLVQIVALAAVCLCGSVILFQSYRLQQPDIDPFLLLACTIGVLVVPTLSHDYKLSILAAPVAVLFSSARLRQKANSSRLQALMILVLLVFSIAYSSTLLSYSYKPLVLQNNFPALMIMLLAVTLLALVLKSSAQPKGT